MKKTILFALSLLMGINAWSYDNVDATFTWAVGNEKTATVTSEAADGVKETKVAVGAGLTTGTKNDYKANPQSMTTFQPAESKPGAVETVMIEYSVKMKKGVTFTLNLVSYSAIKEGTNDAKYTWSYAVDGKESTKTEVPAELILRNDNSNASSADLQHVHAITAAAGQEVSFRIYVSGFANNKKLALSDVKLYGTINGEEIARTFTDFKIEFRTDPYTVLEPAIGLPEGVSVDAGSYHDPQHGYSNPKLTVPVDGPVKFTIGACQFNHRHADVSIDGGEPISIDSQTPGCDDGKGYFTKFVTWTYNSEEPAILTFDLGDYCPFFFAEACEFVPSVEVRYYDLDGKTLIGEPQIVPGGSQLVYAYGEDDINLGQLIFRGWFNASIPTATKVPQGITLNEDLKLYARATEPEMAEEGKIFEYDLTKNYFYPEDHELLGLQDGYYHDAQHGWAFDNGHRFSVQVAGNAVVVLNICQYGKDNAKWEAHVEGEDTGDATITPKECPAKGGDGEQFVFRVEAPYPVEVWFELKSGGECYLHKITVYNVKDFVEKDENTGYYLVPAGDGASLLLTLAQVQDGDKLFLPNGTYDLGERTLTQISKSNISIIGQSMEKTIIKNAPDFHNEGISTTGTFFIPKGVSNTYFQDLTLWNNLDYYAGIAAGMSAGRAVCLQDQGNHTVLKNVRMLSHQDTYYSHNVGVQHYFEDCEIHGTVDFICGGGSVYFKNNVLYCEKRYANGGGNDCVTAHQGKDANGDKGYVFESCVLRSECPVVSFGRAWGDQARTVFLNTLVDYSAGNFGFTTNGIQRWTQTGINTNPTKFGEYNTHLEDGTVLTPTSNVVTFNKGTNVELETVLSTDEAATYTMDYTLGDWSATAAAAAAQVECEKEWADLEADAIYMAECEGEFVMLLKGSEVFDKLSLYDGKTYILRKANARGGFGAPAEGGAQAIDNAESGVKAVKIVRDGLVLIVRDNKIYNVLGAQL